MGLTIAGVLLVSHLLVFVLGMKYKETALAEKEELKKRVEMFIDKKF
jgi:hypothetical protein